MNPKIRREDLIVEELPDETLVYDLKRHKAFCLNRTTSMVWRNCDGKTSTRQLAGILKDAFGVSHPEDLVHLALERLQQARLLSADPAAENGAYRYSRRELGRRLGIAGGLGALLPVVVAITAPTAAAAATCVPDADCQAGLPGTSGLCCCTSRRTCKGAIDRCSGSPC